MHYVQRGHLTDKQTSSIRHVDPIFISKVFSLHCFAFCVWLFLFFFCSFILFLLWFCLCYCNLCRMPPAACCRCAFAFRRFYNAFRSCFVMQANIECNVCACVCACVCVCDSICGLLSCLSLLVYVRNWICCALFRLLLSNHWKFPVFI